MLFTIVHNVCTTFKVPTHIFFSFLILPQLIKILWNFPN